MRDNPNHTQPHLAYPYAIEYDRKLYVVYSAALERGNLNDAELTVIPIEDLKVE